MPNQLAKSKRRQSLAEHEAVLAALAEVAQAQGTTLMALLRKATRELIRKKVKGPGTDAERVRKAVLAKAPQMPTRFRSAAEVARFKRAQREFDQVLLDLGLMSPQALQDLNSIAASRSSIRVLDFDQAHAPKAI